MKISIKHLLLFFIVCISFGSCEKLFRDAFKDEPFSIRKANYYGKELRTDGYYFTRDSTNSSILVIYKNGVVFFAGLEHDSTKLKELFGDEEFMNNLKNNPFCWGLFCIDRDSIMMESFSSDGLTHYIIMESGNILNDTTFRLTKIKSTYNTYMIGDENIDETFHFIKYSPKPDSTNNIIKNVYERKRR